MKASLIVFVLALGAGEILAQGTVRFDNNIPGTLVTHIYRAISPGPGPSGNGPNDTPPGTQDYTGSVFLEGTGYSAQLYSGSWDDPPYSMRPAFPITTFGTGADAGFLVPVTATLTGVRADAAIATLSLRVWDNRGGTIKSWETAILMGATQGYSADFEVYNIGGVNNPPAILRGLQSFTLSYIPEPSPGALLGLGAAALIVLRRRKYTPACQGAEMRSFRSALRPRESRT